MFTTKQNTTKSCIIDQSYRHGRPQAACREPAGSYDKTTRTAICFEHKTQYLLIHAPYTRIVVFWHISNLPPLFRRVKLVVIPPRFIEQQYLWNIAIQPAVGCYKPWANLRCSGCYPLGEKLLWNRSIEFIVQYHINRRYIIGYIMHQTKIFVCMITSHYNKNVKAIVYNCIFIDLN